jgi:hypothetical protein
MVNFITIATEEQKEENKESVNVTGNVADLEMQDINEDIVVDGQKIENNDKSRFDVDLNKRNVSTFNQRDSGLIDNKGETSEDCAI